MNWNSWIRRIHRWLSVIFVAALIGALVVLGSQSTEQGAAAELLAVPTLGSLLFLVLTGVYLFVLPHATKWRRRGAQSRRMAGADD